MPWTNSTLTSAIQAYTQNTETTFVTYIPTFILQVEDRIYKQVIIPSNRKNAAVTFTSGQTTATLPSDFLAPFELRTIVASTGAYEPVDYVDVSLIRSAYPIPATTGTPRWYSIYTDTTMILGPTPGSGVSGWLNYFYKPASITTASTSWLGTNAEMCLLYGCLAEAYTFMMGEPDLAKNYEDKFQEELGRLAKLGEGLDLGDSYRMGERRMAR